MSISMPPAERKLLGAKINVTCAPGPARGAYSAVEIAENCRGKKDGEEKQSCDRLLKEQMKKSVYR